MIHNKSSTIILKPNKGFVIKIKIFGFQTEICILNGSHLC